MVALFCFVLALFALPFKSKSRLEAEKSGLRFKDELAKLASKMQRLKAIEEATLASPDLQISLTDPDLRPMATSGRGSGVVGYNAQVAVDTEYHLIVTHEVTNTGSDRSQLANIASQARPFLVLTISMPSLTEATSTAEILATSKPALR